VDYRNTDIFFGKQICCLVDIEVSINVIFACNLSDNVDSVQVQDDSLIAELFTGRLKLSLVTFTFLVAELSTYRRFVE